MASIQQSSRPSETLRAIANTVRQSALLLLALAGVIVIVFGYILQTGPWAAIFAIWGAGLVIVGVAGYTVIWLDRR